MKPLIVALLVALFESSIAAPQPLSLMTATGVSDSDSTATAFSGDESTQLTTPAEKSIGDDATSPRLDDIEKSNLEMEANRTASVSVQELTTNPGSIESSSTVSSSETVFESSPGTTVGATGIAENTSHESSPIEVNTTEDSKKEAELTLVKYVPPLDPMKHMLLMAEAKRQLETSSHLEGSDIILSPQSYSPKLPVISSPDVSHKETDKKDTEAPEVEKVDASTLSTIASTDPDNITYGELTSKSSDIINSTHVSDYNTEGSMTDIPTTLAVTDTSMNKDDTENVADINHKSSELFSGKEDSLSHETFSESLDNCTTDASTDNPTTIQTSVSPNTTESKEPITTETFLSPTDIKDEESAEESSFLLSREDIDSVEMPEAEVIVEMEANTPLDEEMSSNYKASSSTATEFYTETIETTSQPNSTIKDETLEKLPASQGENLKDVRLDAESELKEKKLSFNASSVVYERTTSSSSGTNNVSLTTSTYSDAEKTDPESRSGKTTIDSILTTIKNIAMDVFTTASPSKEITTPEIESSDVSETSKLLTTSAVSEMVYAAEHRTASEALESNSSTEVLKVELVKGDANTLPTNDTEISTATVFEMSELESNSGPTEEATTLENREQPSSTSEINISEETHSTEEPTTTDSLTSIDDAPLKSELIKSSESLSIPANSSQSFTEKVDEVEKEDISNRTAIQDRYVSGNNTDSIAAVQFLHYHDKSSAEQCFKLVNAHWNYATNLTEENKKLQLEKTLEYSLFHKEAWKNATSFAWKSFNDTLLKRWFKSLSVLGTAALPEDKLNEFNRLKAEMKNTYSTAKICPYQSSDSKAKGEVIKPDDCTLAMEPDIQRILTKSRDYEELAHAWKAWRDATGKPIREKFLRFVDLNNEAARLNGFPDTGDMWREAYESDTFEADMEMLWNQVKPLYENLHAYVRRKLINQYGSDKIKEDGPIPAHLFGNMWSQSWVSLLDVTQPFSGKPSLDVTPIMEAKNLSVLEMFKISEEFFTSLGLKEMPEEFWKYSLIERPKEREVICHPSAWDFCNGKDYRIKQCTDITMEDLITVHHEMGHIQYFLQYARQPNVFREGANPGFHEAIGDVLALSVSTPKHLQSIGLLEEVADDPEGDLNFLLRNALDKVSFLPSGYLIDLWRWGLFSGDIKPQEMNTKWWDLRLKYQGICPPVKRHDTDFDPGSKYHVPGNVPYIRYFVSFVIQFQFHKVLCDASGHTGPLHKCDIYRSKEAGQILSQVMELGSSEHWSEAMKIMTGGATNKMDAGPILEYFQPLLTFLEEQNRNETLGWKSEDSTICP